MDSDWTGVASSLVLYISRDLNPFEPRHFLIPFSSCEDSANFRTSEVKM
jgi:hypothetical protein